MATCVVRNWQYAEPELLD